MTDEEAASTDERPTPIDPTTRLDALEALSNAVLEAVALEGALIRYTQSKQAVSAEDVVLLYVAAAAHHGLIALRLALTEKLRPDAERWRRIIERAAAGDRRRAGGAAQEPSTTEGERAADVQG